MVKIKLKHNETKEFLLNEKKNMEAYMAKLGPGEEYDYYYNQWRLINEDLEKMSLSYKLGKAFPWISLGITAIATIAVPTTLGVLAYRNSEEQGKLKNGDVWREAISNQTRPQNPNITDKM